MLKAFTIVQQYVLAGAVPANQLQSLGGYADVGLPRNVLLKKITGSGRFYDTSVSAFISNVRWTFLLWSPPSYASPALSDNEVDSVAGAGVTIGVNERFCGSDIFPFEVDFGSGIFLKRNFSIADVCMASAVVNMAAGDNLELSLTFYYENIKD
jgi:hypothetical protein